MKNWQKESKHSMHGCMVNDPEGIQVISCQREGIGPTWPISDLHSLTRDSQMALGAGAI
jgi:hypothetical protein